MVDRNEKYIGWRIRLDKFLVMKDEGKSVIIILLCQTNKLNK